MRIIGPEDRMVWESVAVRTCDLSQAGNRTDILQQGWYFVLTLSLKHTFPKVLGTKTRYQHTYKWKHPCVVHSGGQSPHPLFCLTNLPVQTKSWGAFFF